MLAIQPKSFVFKTQPSDPRIGLIAQELQSVAPELVKSQHSSSKVIKAMCDNGPHLAVNYVDLTAYLVGAVQALHAEIKTLKTELSEAKSRCPVVGGKSPRKSKPTKSGASKSKTVELSIAS